MISIIESTKLQAGYVVEEKNASSVELIYYERRKQSLVPNVLEVYSKVQIDELQSEAELRKLFKKHVNPSDTIFFREEVDYLVPKA